MRISHVEAAILAGGASKRMGRDKLRMDWQGVPMVRRVHDALASCIERVRLVTRPGDEPPLQIDAIEDRHIERAPIVGVYAALSACDVGATLVAAGDLPLLKPPLILALLALAPASDGPDVVVPIGPHGPEPLLAIYRKSLLPVIELRIKKSELSLQGLLREADTFEVPEEILRSIDPELESFRNINRPEDLA